MKFLGFFYPLTKAYFVKTLYIKNHLTVRDDSLEHPQYNFFPKKILN